MKELCLCQNKVSLIISCWSSGVMHISPARRCIMFLTVLSIIALIVMVVLKVFKIGQHATTAEQALKNIAVRMACFN